jgi:DNA-binding XRE family transcriptional regulator
LGLLLSFALGHPEKVKRALAELSSFRAVAVYRYFIDITMRKASGRKRGNGDALDWKAVGRRIRELRGFDMTQAEFAGRIAVSQSYFSTMERGEVEIGATILLRIGREFGKSVEWLLTGEERG